MVVSGLVIVEVDVVAVKLCDKSKSRTSGDKRGKNGDMSKKKARADGDGVGDSQCHSETVTHDSQ